MNPLISVVIPAYNHEKYVEETIRSVMAQDYSPVELLVINDGSKDGTYDLAKSYADKYENIIHRKQLFSKRTEVRS